MTTYETIGARFERNAAIMATGVLTRPVLSLDRAGIAVGAPTEDAGTPALLLPREGELTNVPVAGFVKSTKPRHAAHCLAVAWVMQRLGLPSAPCLLLRGNAGLPVVHAKEGHTPDLTLFSPQVFAALDPEPAQNGDDALPSRYCTTGFAESSETQSASLAAAGQARAWLHDWDSCVTNIVRDKRSKAVCLLDHEVAEPWSRDYWTGERLVKEVGFHQDNRNLILRGWETRASSVERLRYLDAAKEAAARIHGLRRRDLAPLAATLTDNGLPVPRRLLDGLLRRRALFARPAVVTPYAERARFNMAPAAPKPRPVA